MTAQKLKAFNIDPATNALVEHPEGRFFLAADAKQVITNSVNQSVQLANAINHMALSLNLIDSPTYDVAKLCVVAHIITETLCAEAVKSGVKLEPVSNLTSH